MTSHSQKVLNFGVSVGCLEGVWRDPQTFSSRTLSFRTLSSRTFSSPDTQVPGHSAPRTLRSFGHPGLSDTQVPGHSAPRTLRSFGHPALLDIQVFWTSRSFGTEHVPNIYMLVLDILYQHLGDECKLEGFCVSGTGLGNVHFLKCIFVLDICCQQFGEHMTVEYIC